MRLPLIATLFASIIQVGVMDVRGEELSDKDESHVRAVVQEHMDKYDVPGLSIAIAKDGKLVFARGFGWADQEKRVAVDPKHRFRVASISKPLTSIAIHKLVEMGRLRLSDRVFGPGGLLGEKYGTPPYGADVRQITVQHLLEHSHGGWDNKDGDPMFQHPEFGHRRLISWTVDKRALDRAPGEGFSYSNFGFCLLGRIIEARSGMRYEGFVREHIARPAGAHSLSIGGNTLADRQPDEVIYYGQNGANPYNMQVARMDAHGGWIATPTDLVRIAVRVDGFSTKPDLLNPRSIRSMSQPSKRKATYAKGWAVNASGNWWHTGSIPGTRCILVRTSGGFCWAMLSNTRSPKPGHAKDLDKLGWRIVNGVESWPQQDLFEAGAAGALARPATP